MLFGSLWQPLIGAWALNRLGRFWRVAALVTIWLPFAQDHVKIRN